MQPFSVIKSIEPEIALLKRYQVDGQLNQPVQEAVRKISNSICINALNGGVATPEQFDCLKLKELKILLSGILQRPEWREKKEGNLFTQLQKLIEVAEAAIVIHTATTSKPATGDAEINAALDTLERVIFNVRFLGKVKGSLRRCLWVQSTKGLQDSLMALPRGLWRDRRVIFLRMLITVCSVVDIDLLSHLAYNAPLLVLRLRCTYPQEDVNIDQQLIDRFAKEILMDSQNCPFTIVPEVDSRDHRQHHIFYRDLFRLYTHNGDEPQFISLQGKSWKSGKNAYSTLADCLAGVNPAKTANVALLYSPLSLFPEFRLGSPFFNKITPALLDQVLDSLKRLPSDDKELFFWKSHACMIPSLLMKKGSPPACLFAALFQAANYPTNIIRDPSYHGFLHALETFKENPTFEGEDLYSDIRLAAYAHQKLKIPHSYLILPRYEKGKRQVLVFQRLEPKPSEKEGKMEEEGEINLMGYTVLLPGTHLPIPFPRPGSPCPSAYPSPAALQQAERAEAPEEARL